jgi:hypothetical protein
LLPGDHIIDKDLLVTPADGKSPTFVKIDGCSHASQLIVKAPVIFKSLAAAVLRDISIVVESNVGFLNCREVEISACLIKGVGKDAPLLRFDRVDRFVIAHNDMRAAAADTAPPTGAALAVLDFDCVATLVDNRIAGVVSLGGLAGGALPTQDELKLLSDLVKRNTVTLNASAGTLHVRGNRLRQLVAGDTALAALRQAVKNKKGPVTVWASAHFTDNILEQGGNYFTARHLSLNTTRFTGSEQDQGDAVANTATYMGNSADTDRRLFSVTHTAPAAAANQGLNLVVL